MLDVRQQILDGKTAFSTADYGGDKDRFFTECLGPIRLLRDKRIIEGIDEVRFNIDGHSYVEAVEIIGAINYEML